MPPQLVPESLLGDSVLTEFFRSQLVAPLGEGALGELHDVALVDQGHRGELLVPGPVQGLADDVPGPGGGDGLDADARVGPDAAAVLFPDQVDDGPRHLAALLEVVAGVDVLGVLAKDDEVHLVGVLVGGGDPLEIADRPHAGVEIQMLPEPDVDGAEALGHPVVLAAFVATAGVVLLVGAVETHVSLLSHRGGEGALDGDAKVPDRLHRLVGKLAAVVVQSLQAGIEGTPGDAAAAAVGSTHRPVHHVAHHRGDVQTDPVAPQDADDGFVADDEAAVPIIDQVSRRDLHCLELSHAIPPEDSAVECFCPPSNCRGQVARNFILRRRPSPWPLLRKVFP